ncbi:hypothetical protein RZS08_44225, partial [Arthrospira platensis SPKY1]|nr:hypothetical protein [Arthrospira platensis SPKY1]
MHWASKNRDIESTARRTLGPVLELGDETRKQIPERERSAQDLGLPLDQAGTEQALQRPHQPPLVALEVLGHRSPTDTHRILVGIEENRRRQGLRVILERQKRGCISTQPADGGVGCAEV